jgi:cyclopropane fatty-acyl-phospholipid synthase-like methyltransferase
MDYDAAYSAADSYFSSEPEAILVDHWQRLDRSRPVLDIGCGQGRNTLFLAREGLKVHALDPSRVAIDTVEAAARQQGLDVRTIHGSFLDLDAEPGSYAGVLVFGLIQELEWSAIRSLARAIRDCTAPGGSLWITAFTTDDPAVPGRAAAWTRIGANSFRAPDGHVNTYLEPGQLPSLFEGFEVVTSWEGLGPEHRHGDGQPERHSKVEAVFVRSPTP